MLLRDLKRCSIQLKTLHFNPSPEPSPSRAGANFINPEDDPRWELLLAVLDRPDHNPKAKAKAQDEDDEALGGAVVPRVVGFCTLCSFFAYPRSPDTEPATRLRLSQLLVQRPFQASKQGDRCWVHGLGRVSG